MQKWTQRAEKFLGHSDYIKLATQICRSNNFSLELDKYPWKISDYIELTTQICRSNNFSPELDKYPQKIFPKSVWISYFNIYMGCIVILFYVVV
jgi:hypothetical protein